MAGQTAVLLGEGLSASVSPHNLPNEVEDRVQRDEKLGGVAARRCAVLRALNRPETVLPPSRVARARLRVLDLLEVARSLSADRCVRYDEQRAQAGRERHESDRLLVRDRRAECNRYGDDRLGDRDPLRLRDVWVSSSCSWGQTPCFMELWAADGGVQHVLKTVEAPRLFPGAAVSFALRLPLGCGMRRRCTGSGKSVVGLPRLPRYLTDWRATVGTADAWNTAWFGLPDDRLDERVADLDWASGLMA